MFYNKIISMYFAYCNSLVDIGCGRGDFLFVARNKAKIVIGCDIDVKPLIVLHLYGFDVVQCDASYLPFKDDSFDGAFFPTL